MRRAQASNEFGLDRAGRLALEVQSCALQRCAEDGLATVDEGLRAAEEARIYRSPFLRQRADLLIRTGAHKSEIEAAYREAIHCARSQTNRFDELEATVHFARWLKPQGRLGEARDMIANIYDWFTEGFDVPTLTEAKTFLDASEKWTSSEHNGPVGHRKKRGLSPSG